MRRRQVLGLIVGTTGGTGCLSSVIDRKHGPPKDAPADCSTVSITSVDLAVSTAGDTIVVRGTVSAIPAPALRGFIIATDGGEMNREDISERITSRGEFARRFGYPHHGIEDYAFWFSGCLERSPTPETDG